MSQQFSTRAPSEYHSSGASRSDRRLQHQVPALGRPRERTWTAMEDPRVSHRPGHHGGYRDGHRRPSGAVSAQHERSGTSRMREVETPPPMPKTHGDGDSHKWFPKFRGAKEREREREKEAKSRTFDKSTISQPLAASAVYLRDTKESQRRLHEPMLAEMGLTHAMDRPPMKLRPIEGAGAPELRAKLEAPVRDERQIRRRPVPVQRPRDSCDSLSRLSTMAVVNEPNGVFNPRWQPRPIDAMAAGYTGSSESLNSSSSSVSPYSSASVSPPSSPEPADKEEFITSRRSKRLGRIFTAEEITTFPEFPEPASDAGEEDNDNGVESEEDTGLDFTESESDFSSVMENVASDGSSDGEPEVVDRYDYFYKGEEGDDQGLDGVILSGSRDHPPVNVIPPTPTSSLPPSPPASPSPPPSPSSSPSLSPDSSPSPPAAREPPVAKRGAAAMDPYRLRVERAWKRAAEDRQVALCQERERRIIAEEDFLKLQRLAIPFLAAFDEILELSDDFRGVRDPMDVPAIVRKILDERDDALDEADAYVDRSLGLETQQHGLVAELLELQAQNQVLRVDNARLRNAQEGLPLETGVRGGPTGAGRY
ncbi:hypothetical protein PG991_002858 [Apiospora marii]|uniref:Uncharacterized protein n=1 Tax=Apiospora marii TaxID=335849 RepID=A0ABR1SGK2_9PEZI